MRRNRLIAPRLDIGKEIIIIYLSISPPIQISSSTSSQLPFSNLFIYLSRHPIICLFIDPAVHRSSHLPTHQLFICYLTTHLLSIPPSIYSFIFPPTCLSLIYPAPICYHPLISLSIHLSNHLPIHQCFQSFTKAHSLQFILSFVHMTIYSPTYPPVHLSVHLRSPPLYPSIYASAHASVSIHPFHLSFQPYTHTYNLFSHPSSILCIGNLTIHEALC